MKGIFNDCHTGNLDDLLRRLIFVPDLCHLVPVVYPRATVRVIPSTLRGMLSLFFRSKRDLRLRPGGKVVSGIRKSKEFRFIT